MEKLSYQKIVLQNLERDEYSLPGTLKKILRNLSAAEIRELEFWMLINMRHACSEEVRDLLEDERARKLVFLEQS